MKYGLIICRNTGNIGDDIQSYAMEKFLPRVDYLIDREHMDSFCPTNGETVAAIFAGWYMHRPLNFPPSPFLKVLPISVHLHRSLHIVDDYGGEWLKKNSPIGCRDEGTVDILKSHNIPAYLSGCVTLTLKPFDPPPPYHGKIVLADVTQPVIDFVKANTTKEIVITSHYPTSLAPDLSASAPIEESWASHRSLVEKLLKFYQGASLVVTRRLHAALPCLALGVPVLLVNKQLRNYRFSTFIPYLNYTKPEDLISKKYVFDFDKPKANPSGHEKFAEKIKTLCTDFVNSCERESDLSSVDVETWLDGYKRSLRLKKIILSLEPSDVVLRKL